MVLDSRGSGSCVDSGHHSDSRCDWLNISDILVILRNIDENVVNKVISILNDANDAIQDKMSTLERERAQAIQVNIEGPRIKLICSHTLTGLNQ